MSKVEEKNWIMVSFPYEFDHHVAYQIVHGVVLESGLDKIGIESMGEFEDDNPVFFLEFETYGPKRDQVITTLRKHAYVQGVEGVSVPPPSSQLRGDSTVPPPPAGTKSIPPKNPPLPIPLSAILPPRILTSPLPQAAESIVPEEAPSLPVEERSGISNILAALGFTVAVEAGAIVALFISDITSKTALLGSVLTSIVLGVGFFFFSKKL